MTVDTPVSVKPQPFETGRILAPLMKASADAKDPLIPFMIWEAAEPKIAEDPSHALRWLAENGPEMMPLSGKLPRPGEPFNEVLRCGAR